MEDEIPTVNVSFRGTTVPVPIEVGSRASEVFQFVQEVGGLRSVKLQ